MKIIEKLGLIGIILIFTNLEGLKVNVNEYYLGAAMFIFVVMFLWSSDKTHSRKEKVVNPISN